MGMRGYSVLTPEQEAVLETQLKQLWMLTDREGNPRFSGKQIAQALGFGGVETLPDGSINPYADLDPERIYHYRHKFNLPKRHDNVRYPHRYKYGKQDAILDLDDMIKKIDSINPHSFNEYRKEAGCCLGFWGGFRNTENRHLTRDHFEFDEDTEGNEVLRIIAFRLKKGKRVTRQQATFPIELRTDWTFVPEIIQWIERFDSGEKPWNIDRTTWWRWHKEVFGKKFYPHWLRENRITFFCSDPRFSIAEIRNWTGLHLVTIENYISKSRRFTLTATQKMNQYMFERH